MVMWFVASLVLVIAELMTGSLYLLTVAFGAAVGGIAAWQGATLWLQIVLSALATLVGAALVNHRRKGFKDLSTSTNPDLQMDIGARIHVDAWTSSGSARVTHRGAQWDAHLAPGALAQTGWFTVQAVEQNRLLLSPDLGAGA